MKNNLFSFATGELSQDGFLCWCANAFNDESKLELKGMSEAFIKKMLHKKYADLEIKSVDVIRQFSRKVEITKGNKITVKIDVLIIVNKNIAIIVEDKTYTGEHDDQINRYKEGLKYLAENKLELDINTRCFATTKEAFDIKDIVSVFLKTGEYYPKDETLREIDDITCVDRKDMLEILEPYKNKSEIVKQYYDFLIELDEWYEDVKKELTLGEYSKALCKEYGQLICAKELFNGNMEAPFEKEPIIFTTGSSAGKPYTWVWLWGKENWYWFAYRIDCRKRDRKEAYCVEFKQYRDYKKNENKTDIAKEKQAIYEFFVEYFEKHLKDFSFDKEKYELYENKGEFNESAIVRFYFDDYTLDELRGKLQLIANAAIKTWWEANKNKYPELLASEQ